MGRRSGRFVWEEMARKPAEGVEVAKLLERVVLSGEEMKLRGSQLAAALTAKLVP